MDKVENIGLIGYGVIGKAIAKELMKSYYHVFVYDNSESEITIGPKSSSQLEKSLDGDSSNTSDDPFIVQ